MMTSCKSKRSYCAKEHVADSGAVVASWSYGLCLIYRESVRGTVKTAGSQFGGPLKLQGVRFAEPLKLQGVSSEDR